MNICLLSVAYSYHYFFSIKLSFLRSPLYPGPWTSAASPPSRVVHRQGTDIRDALNPIRELSAYPCSKSYSLRIR